jgi:NTP pyrophosphatase (non-canonical NTP hydrolase)
MTGVETMKQDLVIMTNGSEIDDALISGRTRLQTLFDLQMHFQNMILPEVKLPLDSPKWFSYHMQGMIEELGEALKADKRWKTHRNTAFNPEDKLDELADIFITTINLALFSGIDANTMSGAIIGKILKNIARARLIGRENERSSATESGE